MMYFSQSGNNGPLEAYNKLTSNAETQPFYNHDMKDTTFEKVRKV